MQLASFDYSHTNSVDNDMSVYNQEKKLSVEHDYLLAASLQLLPLRNFSFFIDIYRNTIAEKNIAYIKKAPTDNLVTTSDSSLDFSISHICLARSCLFLARDDRMIFICDVKDHMKVSRTLPVVDHKRSYELIDTPKSQSQLCRITSLISHVTLPFTAAGCTCGIVDIWNDMQGVILKSINISSVAISHIVFAIDELSYNDWKSRSCVNLVVSDSAGLCDAIQLSYTMLGNCRVRQQRLLQGKAGPVLAMAMLPSNTAVNHNDYRILCVIVMQHMLCIVSIDPVVKMLHKQVLELQSNEYVQLLVQPRLSVQPCELLPSIACWKLMTESCSCSHNNVLFLMFTAQRVWAFNLLHINQSSDCLPCAELLTSTTLPFELEVAQFITPWMLVGFAKLGDLFLIDVAENFVRFHRLCSEESLLLCHDHTMPLLLSNSISYADGSLILLNGRIVHTITAVRWYASAEKLRISGDWYAAFKTYMHAAASAKALLPRFIDSSVSTDDCIMKIASHVSELLLAVSNVNDNKIDVAAVADAAVLACSILPLHQFILTSFLDVFGPTYAHILLKKLWPLFAEGAVRTSLCSIPSRFFVALLHDPARNPNDTDLFVKWLKNIDIDRQIDKPERSFMITLCEANRQWSSLVLLQDSAISIVSILDTLYNSAFLNLAIDEKAASTLLSALEEILVDSDDSLSQSKQILVISWLFSHFNRIQRLVTYERVRMITVMYNAVTVMCSISTIYTSHGSVEAAIFHEVRIHAVDTLFSAIYALLEAESKLEAMSLAFFVARSLLTSSIFDASDSVRLDTMSLLLETIDVDLVENAYEIESCFLKCYSSWVSNTTVRLDLYDRWIALASRLSFWRVQQLLLKKLGRTFDLIKLYCRISHSYACADGKDFIALDPADLFDTLASSIPQYLKNPSDELYLQTLLLENVVDLCRIDVVRLAALIRRFFPELFIVICDQKLADYPQLFFDFVDAWCHTDTNLHSALLELSPKLQLRYIELLCNYKPDQVRTLLQTIVLDSNFANSILQTIRNCQHSSAEAYLLRCLGDENAALIVLVTKLVSVIRNCTYSASETMSLQSAVLVTAVDDLAVHLREAELDTSENLLFSALQLMLQMLSSESELYNAISFSIRRLIELVVDAKQLPHVLSQILALSNGVPWTCELLSNLLDARFSDWMLGQYAVNIVRNEHALHARQSVALQKHALIPVQAHCSICSRPIILGGLNDCDDAALLLCQQGHFIHLTCSIQRSTAITADKSLNFLQPSCRACATAIRESNENLQQEPDNHPKLIAEKYPPSRTTHIESAPSLPIISSFSVLGEVRRKRIIDLSHLFELHS